MLGENDAGDDSTRGSVIKFDTEKKLGQGKMRHCPPGKGATALLGHCAPQKNLDPVHHVHSAPPRAYEATHE